MAEVVDIVCDPSPGAKHLPFRNLDISLDIFATPVEAVRFAEKYEAVAADPRFAQHLGAIKIVRIGQIFTVDEKHRSARVPSYWEASSRTVYLCVGDEFRWAGELVACSRKINEAMLKAIGMGPQPIAPLPISCRVAAPARFDLGLTAPLSVAWPESYHDVPRLVNEPVYDWRDILTSDTPTLRAPIAAEYYGNSVLYGTSFARSEQKICLDILRLLPAFWSKVERHPFHLFAVETNESEVVRGRAVIGGNRAIVRPLGGCIFDKTLTTLHEIMHLLGEKDHGVIRATEAEASRLLGFPQPKNIVVNLN